MTARARPNTPCPLIFLADSYGTRKTISAPNRSGLPSRRQGRKRHCRRAGYATMNRLLGSVIRISNTVDCALQTYFHLNFQFGTLWRSSRRENRFDDIRCEVACVHCAFICFNRSSVGRGSKIAVRSTTGKIVPGVLSLAILSSSTIMVCEKLGDGRVRRHFYSVLFDCSLGFGKLDLWFQRWLPSGEKRGPPGRASCDCSSARGASSARDVPFVSPFESNPPMRTHLG